MSHKRPPVKDMLELVAMATVLGRGRISKHEDINVDIRDGALPHGASENAAKPAISWNHTSRPKMRHNRGRPPISQTKRLGVPQALRGMHNKLIHTHGLRD